MVELLIATALAAAPAQQERAIPWSEVRADIAETICVLDLEPPDGMEVPRHMIGFRSVCTGEEARTPLSRAVDKAIDYARFFGMSNSPVAFRYKLKKGVSAAEMTKALREELLGSEDFLRPILSGLPAALSAEGLTCIDCPTFTTKPARHVSWNEFLPYLTVHISPNPVGTPRGPDGKLKGSRVASFEISTQNEGIKRMKNPDPILLRAGAFAAATTIEVREKVNEYLLGFSKEEDYAGLTEDTARANYLRKRLSAALAGDREIRIAVCEALARYSNALGLKVDNCE
jgi:hypothetical protein